MRETGRDTITIDRTVCNDDYLGFEIVEYSLKIKSAIYFNLDEDEIVSEEYIATCLINQIKATLANENVSFAIQLSINEQKQEG